MSSHLKGPSEGDWSVFAEKVVAERDAAREEVAALRRELGALKARYGHLPAPSEPFTEEHALAVLFAKGRAGGLLMQPGTSLMDLITAWRAFTAFFTEQNLPVRTATFFADTCAAFDALALKAHRESEKAS